jgi:hypothetical protein
VIFLAPNHDPLKIGTLSGIITDLAEHFAKLSKTIHETGLHNTKVIDDIL